MSRTPAPNQLRWMAGRTAIIATITGAAVGVLFSDLKVVGSAAFPQAFLLGTIAGATSFAVSMLLFVVTMPRLNPRLAVFVSLVLGILAGFVLGSVLPIENPA